MYGYKPLITQTNTCRLQPCTSFKNRNQMNRAHTFRYSCALPNPHHLKFGTEVELFSSFCKYLHHLQATPFTGFLVFCDFWMSQSREWTFHYELSTFSCRLKSSSSFFIYHYKEKRTFKIIRHQHLSYPNSVSTKITAKLPLISASQKSHSIKYCLIFYEFGFLLWYSHSKKTQQTGLIWHIYILSKESLPNPCTFIFRREHYITVC